MTGTNLSAIVPPIVAMISLAVWLAMVFYADAHPAVRRQAPAKPGPEPAVRASADSGGELAARPSVRRPDLARR
jgi:hypothetical protein